MTRARQPAAFPGEPGGPPAMEFCQWGDIRETVWGQDWVPCRYRAAIVEYVGPTEMPDGSVEPPWWSACCAEHYPEFGMGTLTPPSDGPEEDIPF